MNEKRFGVQRRLARKTLLSRPPTLVERLERRTLLSGAAPTTGADFFGQLGGWISVSPSGDVSGNTDTANIQNALNEVGTPGFSSTVYLNAGTYRINQSLVFRGKYESNIIGADPATTIIQWTGASSNTTGQAMLISVGNTICQVNRVTFDGQNQIDDGILDGYRPLPLAVNALGALSNTGASGFYGNSFTTQNAPVKILGIQRWIPANLTTTQSHFLELVDAATNNVIFSGTLSAGYVGGAAGHFSGVGFTSDVTLAANHTYYLLSQEFNGGDPWYDDTTSFSPDHVLVRSINGSVDDVGGTLHVATTGEHSFGPMNLVEDTSAATGDAEKFPTNNAFTDDIIKNFQGTLQAPGHGFTAGIFARQASETLLERDTFSNCGTNTGNVIGTGGGVYLFGQNTIDWWIRDCEFDHNSVGVVTNFGGYSMDVQDCVFNSDSLVDLYLPQGYSTAVRDSTSINSNQFIRGQVSEDIIQNDLVLDPSSTTLPPISLPAGVQLTLLDTTIRNNPAYTGPDVVVGQGSDILAAGNTFAVPAGSVASYNPYSQGEESLLRTLDSQNADLASSLISSLVPQTLPGAPVQMPWTPIEVVPTGTANTDVTNINNAIAAAKASIDAGATGAVIHLQDRNSGGVYTTFNLNSTIIIPAGYPIELVGDGEAWSGGLAGTALNWTGAVGGTILDLGGATLGVPAGPSCASISNLGVLSGSNAGDGIRVENADQVGGSVYSDDSILGISGSPSPVEYTQNAVFADGLSNTNVQLLDFTADGATAVKVTGGTSPGSGGNVGVFMGAGASEAVQYSVSNGGKLLVEDQYLEEDSGYTNQWAHADNGTYTVQGAVIKANVAGVDAANPPISVSGSSNVSVLSASAAAGIIVQPGATSNLLAAGNGGWGSNSGNAGEMGPFAGPLDYAPQSKVALVENGNASDQINANISDADAFLREMLAQTRNFHAELLSQSRNLTATDVRLFNINVTGAVNDIHLVGSTPGVAADLPPAPTTPSAPTNVSAFPSGAGGSQIDVNFQAYGTHLIVPPANAFDAQVVNNVNNYTGMVGTRFTTGAKPILVTQLGRFVVGGDSQSHTLKLVRVSDLSVVGQATLQTSSAQANQFAYVSLASPVMLAPNTAYYLVTSETSGGDLYVGGAGVQWTSIVQSIDGMVKFDTTNGWQPTLNGGVDLGAVDLVASPLPDMAGQGITTGVRTGGLAAGIGNFEGLRFTTGPTPVSVTNLGRWIPANATTTQAHTLELVDASNGSVIASTTLAAGQSGGAGGQFEYAALADPVTLAANHSYYLVSNEFTSGDQVYVNSAMRLSNLIAGVDGTVTNNGSAWNFTARPGFADGPLDFLGQADTSPVSYTIYRSASSDMSGATPIATGLNTTSFIDTTAAAGTLYHYTVAGVNQSGVGATLGEGSASLGTALPSGWSDTDIGTPPIAGSAWTNNGSATSFTVQGSGTQSSNQWNFAYETVPVGSSFTATVKLTSLSQYGDPIAGFDQYKGALMIRDGLATTAHVAFVDVSATFTQFDGVNGDQEPFPIYFQLQANYNPVNKSYSVVGYYLNSLGQPIKPFNSPGPVGMFNANNLYVGVAADSNGAAGITTATFDNFSIVNGVDQPPATPSNTSPTNNATAQSLTPTLTASGFSDPDAGDTQSAAEWVVTRVSDNAVVYDSGTDTTNLNSTTLPAGALANSVAYSWHVRYQDNHGAWSNFSAPTTFTTLASVPVNTPTFSAPAGSYTTFVSITISDTTAGATIHYTTDGSTPTASSPTYSTPVVISASSTLQAIAVNAGQPNSAVQSAAYTIVVATPTISPAAGTYTTSTSVTINDGTAGATIHYTTDGATPTASSPTYSVPLAVSTSQTIMAIAIKNGLTTSAAATAAYTIVAATPTFSAAAGMYANSVSVTISDLTPGATIHYTTNGTTPTAASATYSAALKLSSSQTLEAIAIKNGLTNSAVMSAAYVIAASTPVITPAGGTYTGSVTVKITDATSGAVIHYTTDGSTPTASSPVYSAAFTVSSAKTVNAIAVKSGLATSAVALAAYTFAAAAPTFSQKAGNYLNSVSVTLKTTTSGASIHYTLDGSTPTASSPLYSAALNVKSTTTIEAIAIKAGLTSSTVSSATYTIVPSASVTTLSSGKSVSGLSASQGVQKFFQIVVPSGKTSLTISITGGTGNADLYLRRSSLPSTLTYDSRSVASGDTETITLKSPVAGTYYILLYGTAAYSGVTLKAV